MQPNISLLIGVPHSRSKAPSSAAALVSDKIRTSKASGLAKAMGLMREHSDDLGWFITEDEKGRKLPAYLENLARHLTAEQESMRELADLTKNIDHIKKIVSTQQSHASARGVIETVYRPFNATASTFWRSATTSSTSPRSSPAR